MWTTSWTYAAQRWTVRDQETWLRHTISFSACGEDGILARGKPCTSVPHLPKSPKSMASNFVLIAERTERNTLVPCSYWSGSQRSRKPRCVPVSYS